MARFFTRSEVAPTTLHDKKIAVIGYGNQGRAQAINLRRAGYQVLIGNQQDSSWDQAREDGFSPQPAHRLTSSVTAPRRDRPRDL